MFTSLVTFFLKWFPDILSLNFFFIDLLRMEDDGWTENSFYVSVEDSNRREN